VNETTRSNYRSDIQADSKTTNGRYLAKLKNGKLYNTDVIFYHIGYKVQTQLAKQLGCHLEEGFIKVVNKQETTVAKDYAAGDADTDRHYVVLAVASGAVAAISIYEDFLKKALENNIRIE